VPTEVILFGALSGTKKPDQATKKGEKKGWGAKKGKSAGNGEE